MLLILCAGMFPYSYLFYLYLSFYIFFIYLNSLKGHLFCKECIYENILSQKKEIKRQKKLFSEKQQEEQVLISKMILVDSQI